MAHAPLLWPSLISTLHLPACLPACREEDFGKPNCSAGGARSAELAGVLQEAYYTANDTAGLVLYMKYVWPDSAAWVVTEAGAPPEMWTVYSFPNTSTVHLDSPRCTALLCPALLCPVLAPCHAVCCLPRNGAFCFVCTPASSCI